MDDRKGDYEVMTTTCPACKKTSLKVLMIKYNVPYFGEIVQNTATCEKCGFKHTDIMITEQNEPVRYEVSVDREDDMSIRVIRSTSGTIRIPELGVLVEPGPASQAYITNVEGILNRVENALHIILDNPENEESRNRALEVLEKIEQVKKGQFNITLIIEDPYGNSAIISPKATKTVLSNEEASEMRSGEFVIDLSQDKGDSSD